MNRWLLDLEKVDDFQSDVSGEITKTVEQVNENYRVMLNDSFNHMIVECKHRPRNSASYGIFWVELDGE